MVAWLQLNENIWGMGGGGVSFFFFFLISYIDSNMRLGLTVSWESDAVMTTEHEQETLWKHEYQQKLALHIPNTEVWIIKR